MLTLAAICLVSALVLRLVLAERAPRGIGNAAPVSGAESRVLGEFEGSFDPKSRRLKIYEASSDKLISPSLRRLTLQARSEANTDVPLGSFSWGSSKPGLISGA